MGISLSTSTDDSVSTQIKEELAAASKSATVSHGKLPVNRLSRRRGQKCFTQDPGGVERPSEPNEVQRVFLSPTMLVGQRHELTNLAVLDLTRTSLV